MRRDPKCAKNSLVRGDPPGQRRSRARQEIVDGRRGHGNMDSAFVPATGTELTAAYGQRSTANVVDFLGQVEAWLDPGMERIYAVLDNLSAHRAVDVQL